MDRQVCVLVVDDSKVMRGVVRQMLRCDSIAVLEAGDGRQALQVLATSPVDCIISDWNMPRMKGIDLLRRVRADGELAGIPFVMLTAECLTCNLAEADEANVSCYLTKPFTSEELWGVLRQVLPERCPAG